MTTDADTTYQRIATVAETADEMEVGDRIDIEGPDDKTVTVFVESIKGRRCYRIVRHVPGKGQSRRYVREDQHYETGADSTFSDNLALAYRWMGIDPLAH